MRVLNVAHGNPLRTGGASRVAFRLRNLVETMEGWEGLLAFAASHDDFGRHTPSLRGFDSESRASMVLSKTDHSLQFPATARDYVESWSDYLLAVKPDIVHVHNFMNVGVQFPFIVKRACPTASLIFTAHEYLYECSLRGQLVRRSGERCAGPSVRMCANCTGESQGWVLRRESSVRASFAAYDRVVSPSRFLARRLTSFGVPTDKVIQLANPSLLADGDALPADLSSYRSRGPSNRGGARLLFLAASTPERGLLDVLRVVRKLCDRGGHTRPLLRVMIDWQVVREQPPAWQDEVLEHAEFLAGAIEVLPHMGPEQLVEVMLETDVLINASQWPENSPLTISDALQLGVGVVAPAIGGITELLEGREDGFTFLTGSSAALEGALMEAVTWARGRARPSEFMGSATERVLRDARSYRTLLESVSTN